MAAKNSTKLLIHLNLIKSQTSPSDLPGKIIRFISQSAKYILILIEFIVLIAFFYKFTLEGGLTGSGEEINDKKEYIMSQTQEVLILKEAQLKLTKINEFYTNYINFPGILKDIADQTPPGIIFDSLLLEKQADKIVIKLSAKAQKSSDVANFTIGLKTAPNLNEVNLTNLSIEQNTIKFSITMSAPLKSEV